MLFSSFIFLSSFAIFFCLYLLLKCHNRARILLTLLASYVFYGYWDPRFLGLLFCSTCVDYWVAKMLESNSAPGIRRGLLYIGVSSNLLILGIFKYYDFFAASATTLIAALGLHVQPILLDLSLIHISEPTRPY